MPSFVTPAQQRSARVGDAILRFPDFAKATQGDFGQKKVAIFIHGFTADANYMRDLMHQFDGAGFATFAFEYECFRGIDEAAKSLYQLLALLDGGQSISGNRVVLVGHSMGGLVARALITLENGARFVRKVITLGSPNAGTLTNATMLRYMANWGEAISGANPRGYSPKCKSALQLLGKDGAHPLVNRLMLPSLAPVEFYSISGGYNQLDFGKGFWKNFLSNRYLQKHLTSPNDGLVSELSSDLSQAVFSACAPGCRHINNYPDYSNTNHTYLSNNQSIALQAIQCAQ